jgi:excisionase family DNA binding protein
MEGNLLSADDLAARLRVRPSTVRAWARADRIPAIRIGPKTLRFDFAEVLRAIRARRRGGLHRD